MTNIIELKRAWENKEPLVWNDPDPIEGNDYTITWIEDLTQLDNEDRLTPILIRYNDGEGVAEVFLHEILYKVN